MESYKHSGASGATGVPLAAMLGTVTAVVLGVVYAYSINWIPLVYFNFFATIILGLGIGLAVGLGAQWGKIRNDWIVGAIGLLCGLIGLYVAWAVDPLARFGEDGMLAFSPEILWEYVQVFYANGFWGIGRGGGAPVSGMFLAGVWVFEAVLIIGAAVFLSAGYLAGHPFCESCYRWADQKEDVQRLSAAAQDESHLSRLLDGDVMALTDLYRAEPEEANHLRLDLATCPSCTESNYLSVIAVQESVNKKGEVETNVQPLLTNLLVAEPVVELVRGAGRKRPADDVIDDSAETATDEKEMPDIGV